MEAVQQGLVAAVNPARRRQVDRRVNGIHRILIFKTRNDDVKLEDADGSQDVVVAERGAEDLHGTLLGQLLEALLELLGLEGALEDDLAEVLGREARDARELELLLGRERVADTDGAVVVQADDVAGVGLLHARAVLGHEDGGVTDLHVLADAVVADLHAFFVLSGADAQESNAIPMFGVHIGLNFEYKPGELFIRGTY